jgi:hypothetical protein
LQIRILELLGVSVRFRWGQGGGSRPQVISCAYGVGRRDYWWFGMNGAKGFLIREGLCLGYEVIEFYLQMILDVFHGEQL